MELFSQEDKHKIRMRHLDDQIGAISPQGLRELQATKGEDGKPLFTWSQRRQYLRRADQLEKESGQR